MPDSEEIMCITAASGIVACATNARLLRLFTSMGTQRQVSNSHHYYVGEIDRYSDYHTTYLVLLL